MRQTYLTQLLFW